MKVIRESAVLALLRSSIGLQWLHIRWMGARNRGQDRLMIANQQLGRLGLSDDLLGCVRNVFHGRNSSPGWPVKGSHSP
jgi:hypothetical protein